MIRRLLPLPIAKDLDWSEPSSCCRALGTGGAYCHNCDLIVGLHGLHVTDVRREPELLTVTLEDLSNPDHARRIDMTQWVLPNLIDFAKHGKTMTVTEFVEFAGGGDTSASPAAASVTPSRPCASPEDCQRFGLWSSPQRLASSRGSGVNATMHTRWRVRRSALPITAPSPVRDPPLESTATASPQG